MESSSLTVFACLLLLLCRAYVPVETTPANGLSYAGLGGDSTAYCVNVPFRLTLAPVGTTDTIYKGGTSWTVTPQGYCTQVGDITVTSNTVPSHFDLKCSRAQTYLIKAFTGSDPSTGAVQIKLTVDNCQDLYGWYAVAVAPLPSGSGLVVVDKAWKSDNLTIRLWIQSREMETDVVLNPTGDAIAPVDKEAALTKTFQRMGLSPRLVTNFRDQFDVYFYCDTAIPPVFDTGGFWVFTCPRNTNDRYGYYNYGPTNESWLFQSGNSIDQSSYNQTIALQELTVNTRNLTVELTYQLKVQVTTAGRPDHFGYTVSQNVLTLSRTKYQLPISGGTTLTWTGKPAIRYEPCNSNFIISLHTSGIYMTADEFLTPPSLLVVTLKGAVGSVALAEVQVVKSYIYFLTSTGVLYALSRTATDGVANVVTPILPAGAGPLVGLRVKDWCTSPSNTATRDVFVAWSTNMFVITTSDGAPTVYNTVTVPSSTIFVDGGKIIDMALDRTDGRSACFLLLSSSAGVFVHYYYRTKDSPEPDNWLGGVAGQQPEKTFGNGQLLGLGSTILSVGDAHLHPLIHGDPGVIVTLASTIWKLTPDKAVPYSLTNDGGTFASVQMAQFARGGNLFFLASGTTLKIYLGDANAVELTMIKDKIPADSVLRLDRFDNLWVIDIPQGKTKDYLDSDTQLLNSGGDSVSCPYTILDVSGDELYMPIDIGSTYTVLAYLWFPVGATIDLEVLVSQPPVNNPFAGNYLNATILTDHNVEGDVVRITKTIMLQSAFNHQPDDVGMAYVARRSPMTTVTIHPSVVKPSCTSRSQRVYFAKATCPAGLSIRLIPQTPCTSAYPATLTIPIDYLGPHAATQPVTLPTNLQCDSPYYRDPYVPQFGLYYFDYLVKNVTVDFYLFEKNWRNDYTYNATESDAGCQRAAQTYSTTSNRSCAFYPVYVRANDTYACWGPANYDDCFASPFGNQSSRNDTRLYEILNSTGPNAINFPFDHVPVYVFVAQILDRNYSFCNLATQFVIMPQGYGDTPDALIPVWCFLASCAALIILFWVIYAIYAVSWNENRVGFQMLEKQMAPRAWNLLTNGEHKLLYTGNDGRRKVYLPGDVAQRKPKNE